MKDLSKNDKVSKEIKLQRTIKTINDIVNLDDLVFILLVFEAYSQMHIINLLNLNIIQRVAFIKKAMNEIRNIHAKSQMNDELNTRDESMIISFHELFINSSVLVYREDNARKSQK